MIASANSTREEIWCNNEVLEEIQRSLTMGDKLLAHSNCFMS